MKFIVRIPNYAEGIKAPVFDFNVFSQLIIHLKEKQPSIAAGFEKATTGFGTRVTNEIDPSMPHEVLAVTFDNQFCLGHVVGSTYEVKRFLDEYQKALQPKSLLLGNKVLYKNEVVLIEWVSRDLRCGGGHNQEGKGFAFNLGDPDLKAFP